MGHRALIAKIDPDTDDVKYVYLHEGSPDTAGKALVLYYQQEEKIDELLDNGFLAYLGANIGEKTTRNDHSDFHFKYFWNDDFEKPNPMETQCLFYIRDIGESLEESGPMTVDRQEFFFHGVDNIGAETLYVRSNGVWFCAKSTTGDKTSDFDTLKPMHRKGELLPGQWNSPNDEDES